MLDFALVSISMCAATQYFAALSGAAQCERLLTVHNGSRWFWCRAVGERCYLSGRMAELFIELLLHFYYLSDPVGCTHCVPSNERRPLEERPSQHQRPGRIRLHPRPSVRVHWFIIINIVNINNKCKNVTLSLQLTAYLYIERSKNKKPITLLQHIE